ncbi:MAG TPA: N-acetylmuramoyl-L-alanine amidase [Chloroflexia bacterium]|nr:N-acetylmuramoyl-L-alanine amidase [Chloroflexia bacterium]
MIKLSRKLAFFTLLIGFASILIACGDSGSTPTIPPTTVNPIPTRVIVPTPTPAPEHIVVIDPGHGGDDWGAFHSNASDQPDLLEKDITLQLGLKTAELLQDSSIQVFLTRTKDTLANDPPADLNGDGKIDENDDLLARIKFANAKKADLFFSIHVNSSDLGNDAYGLETLYCADRPFANQSKAFAALVQKQSIDSLKAFGYTAQDRQVMDDIEKYGADQHLFVLGPTGTERPFVTEMPGALTEALFITNDEEASVLRNPKAIAALAGGYATAIQEYFKQAKDS